MSSSPEIDRLVRTPRWVIAAYLWGRPAGDALQRADGILRALADAGYEIDQGDRDQ